MTASGTRSDQQKRTTPAGDSGSLPLEHYLWVVYHRKWLVLSVFLIVSLATAAVSYRLPNVFTSETVILVDPQKVPESYVKSTVTGDIRNRLGTLSQQILSATRLQKIIETFNLFAEERKTMAREDVIALMRSNISVNVLSQFSSNQELQAFRISYSGEEPRLVASVTNELASLFIDENLKAREQQATGTSEFLQNQLDETRKTLQNQENTLKDFRLKHLGEMPEQENADLQLLGQLQSQQQLEGEALARAEQTKSYLQSTMQQSTPVVDLDPFSLATPSPPAQAGPPPAAKGPSTVSTLKTRLTALEARYTEKHPEVQKLKQQIAEEEAKEASAAPPEPPVPQPPPPAAAPALPPARPVIPPPTYTNPVLQAQLKSVEDEIAKHKQEQDRLRKLATGYQVKLEAIPVNEQRVADLVRDYEISKAHYSQLLNNQLSAQTATQLEIRQKGEKFSILDPAQAAEKPSRPNRILIDTAGCMGGLGLGLLAALITQFLGISITSPQQLLEASGVPVLEVIPVIYTHADLRSRRKRLVLATVSGAALTALACAAVLVWRFRV